MFKKWTLAFAVVALALGQASAQDKKIRVILIDGENNHQWRQTSPVMKQELEKTGRFTVDIASHFPTDMKKLKTPLKVVASEVKGKNDKDPPKKVYKVVDAEGKSVGAFSGNRDGEVFDNKGFKIQDAKGVLAKVQNPDQTVAFPPDLTKYDVVLSNYNGPSWPANFNTELDETLKANKIGLVIVHAANNAFGGWKNYDLMIGMGWRGAGAGKRLKLDDEGKTVIVPAGEDQSSGHRYSGQFQVVIRDPNHPVTKGMPREWMHNNDELYDNMRGPIENIHLLGTAYSKGTKVHEPMIWTVSYGKGRVFHTPMGHDVTSMRCIGFLTTLARGTEWVATETVTLPIPSNFPSADKTSTIPAEKK